MVIPTRLDKLSADGVYRVLRTLRVLARGANASDNAQAGEATAICPHLEVVSVVPNFVRRRSARPISVQQQILDELPQSCKSAWGKAIPITKEGIPESSQFSWASLEGYFSAEQQPLVNYFRDIRDKLLQKMAEVERERRRAAAVS